MNELATLLLAQILQILRRRVIRGEGREIQQYAHAECVRRARNGPCVVLSIVTRELRGARQGCRRKEGKPRNKAVAPVTHE